MRQSTLVLILLTVAIGVGLFLVKYRVQGLEGELNNLNRDIASGRERIHVLKAEWSHLNQPARLRDLAERYLGLGVVEPDQIGTLIDFFPDPVASGSPEDQSVMPLTAQIQVEEVRP